MMTPGTYLQKRRIAAGLSIMDVAAMVHTNPRLGGIDKVAWIDRIEKDIAALSPDVIATLADAFRFSRTILLQLITIRSFGADAIDPQPRICIMCACTDNDACSAAVTGESCAWDSDHLCTFCITPDPALPAAWTKEHRHAA
ncbi:MAG: helix-turn-helix transcriptional regulator [Sphingobium limneticum]